MTEDRLNITACPTCGSEQIRRVCRDVDRQTGEESYRVASLTFHECPDCGEQVFDRQAMRRIEECSPAYAKTHTR